VTKEHTKEQNLDIHISESTWDISREVEIFQKDEQGDEIFQKDEQGNDIFVKESWTLVERN